MEKFVLATRRFLRDEEGVTAIEYGLILPNLGVCFHVIFDSMSLPGVGKGFPAEFSSTYIRFIRSAIENRFKFCEF